MTKVFKRFVGWLKAMAGAARRRAEARQYGRLDGELQALREIVLFAANIFLVYEAVVAMIAFSEGVLPIKGIGQPIVRGFLGVVIILTMIVATGYFLIWLPITTCRKYEDLVMMIVAEMGSLLCAAILLISERSNYDSLAKFEGQQLSMLSAFRIGWAVSVGTFILLSLAIKIVGYVRRTRERAAKKAEREEH